MSGSGRSVPSDASAPRTGVGSTLADGGVDTQADGGEERSDVTHPQPDAGTTITVGERENEAIEKGVGGGTGGGSGSGGPSIVSVGRSYSGPCNVPGDAQLENVSSPTTVIGTGTPGSCSGEAFVAAVAKGGVITFNCGPNPHTIVLNQTAKVVNSTRKVVIDGGGKITLSGGGRVRILYQNTCDAALGHATARCDNQSFPELTVQNLTFVDGNARGAYEGDGGGAIYASGGRFKILNSAFHNNACVDSGPDAGGGAVRALYQYNNQPVYIVNSTFGGAPGRGNSGSNGGALSTIGVSFQLIGSTLTYNRATGHGANPQRAGTPGGGSGGAIYTDGTTYSLRLCDTTIANNTASEGGGGVFFVSNDDTGHFSIEGSRLYSNTGGTFDNHPGMFVKNSGNSPSYSGSSEVR